MYLIPNFVTKSPNKDMPACSRLILRKWLQILYSSRLSLCHMKFETAKHRIHGALVIKGFKEVECLSFKGFDLLYKNRRKTIFS